MSEQLVPLEGELVRDEEGKFVQGTSGNPMGRPKGSKNKITLLKIAAEEGWRERNMAKINQVLDQICEDALDGDKGARKMIFEAIVSKGGTQEEKSATNKQVINVHRMSVNQTKTNGESNGE